MTRSHKSSVHGTNYLVHLIRENDHARTECGREALAVNCAINDEPREELCRSCTAARQRRAAPAAPRTQATPRLEDLADEWERSDAAAHERCDQLTASECAQQLREALRWIPYHSSTLPTEQGEYLCRTRGGTRVVLEWDGIAWDHPVRTQRDWRYWNEAVEYWFPLPKDPEPLVIGPPCNHDECSGHGACLRQRK